MVRLPFKFKEETLVTSDKEGNKSELMDSTAETNKHMRQGTSKYISLQYIY